MRVMVDLKGIEPSNLTDANRALSQTELQAHIWLLRYPKMKQESTEDHGIERTCPLSQLSYGPI